MGCDIHIVVELKQNDKWVRVISTEATYSGRNYTLFSILAGIRNSECVTPIDEPRGLPKDFTTTEYLGDHSYSWLTLREINDWPHWGDECYTEETLQEYCGDFFEWLDGFKHTRLEWENPENIRLVFGFDS